MTPAGFVFIGIVIGGIIGYIVGTIRERNGKNKWTAGVFYSRCDKGIPESYHYRTHK